LPHDSSDWNAGPPRRSPTRSRPERMSDKVKTRAARAEARPVVRSDRAKTRGLPAGSAARPSVILAWPSTDVYAVVSLPNPASPSVPKSTRSPRSPRRSNERPWCVPNSMRS